MHLLPFEGSSRFAVLLCDYDRVVRAARKHVCEKYISMMAGILGGRIDRRRHSTLMCLPPSRRLGSDKDQAQNHERLAVQLLGESRVGLARVSCPLISTAWNFCGRFGRPRHSAPIPLRLSRGRDQGSDIWGSNLIETNPQRQQTSWPPILGAARAALTYL